jgi:hypothetical protein
LEQISSCMKPPAIFGSAILSLGVGAGALLAPQAASAALNFNFSFADVSGSIQGLQEGLNSCTDAQQCKVIVEIAPGQTGAYIGQYNYVNGNGFIVSGSMISSADWDGSSPSGVLILRELPQPSFGGLFGPNGIAGGSPVIFRPQSSDAPAVPGPVPLLGAAAALHCSRRLRNRIKGISSTVPTTPFA